MHTYTSIYLSIYISIYLSIYLHIYIYIYIYTSMCIHTYIYIYICTYIYIYIYIYTHMYVWGLVRRLFLQTVSEPAFQGGHARAARTGPGSTAKIYTYTPIISSTVYIILIRHCKYLLVVVYKLLSRRTGPGPRARRRRRPPPDSSTAKLDKTSFMSSVFMLALTTVIRQTKF